MSDDGGPAFPVDENVLVGSEGMTLRDYFAGQALASVYTEALNHDMEPSCVASDCYLYADAMLAERAKGCDRG